MVSGIVGQVTCGSIAGRMEVARASPNFAITISGLYGIRLVALKSAQMVDVLNVC